MRLAIALLTLASFGATFAAPLPQEGAAQTEKAPKKKTKKKKKSDEDKGDKKTS